MKMCSENMQSNLIEIALRHVCFCVNLLDIFRKPFPKNTPERAPILRKDLDMILKKWREKKPDSHTCLKQYR